MHFKFISLYNYYLLGRILKPGKKYISED